MGTPIERQKLSQAEKQKSFAKAFATIESHREQGNFLGAYVVAFSVFEDRITAATMWAADLAKKNRPTKPVRLYGRIDTLAKHINAATESDWRVAGDERNELVHAAMWNVDVFEDRHVKIATKRARDADKLARKLGRLAKKEVK